MFSSMRNAWCWKYKEPPKCENCIVRFRKSPKKSQQERQIVGRNEFRGERGKSLHEWNIEENIIENPVGDYGNAGNRELEEENA